MIIAVAGAGKTYTAAAKGRPWQAGGNAGAEMTCTDGTRGASAAFCTGTTARPNPAPGRNRDAQVEATARFAATLTGDEPTVMRRIGQSWPLLMTADLIWSRASRSAVSGRPISCRPTWPSSMSASIDPSP